MTTLEFKIIGLEPSPYGFVMLVLHRVPHTHTMRIRLGAVDAEPMAAELAGIQTVRSRLAGAMRRLVEQLDGKMAHVWLRRGTGNMVEAELAIETTLEHITVPVTCGDALALAVAHKLPVLGDMTLEALMQPVQVETNDVALPVEIEAFLSSL